MKLDHGPVRVALAALPPALRRMSLEAEADAVVGVLKFLEAAMWPLDCVRQAAKMLRALERPGYDKEPGVRMLMSMRANLNRHADLMAQVERHYNELVANTATFDETAAQETVGGAAPRVLWQWPSRHT